MKNFRGLMLMICTTIISTISLAQTITITAPNGGEVLYSCQQYQITWNQTAWDEN